MAAEPIRNPLQRSTQPSGPPYIGGTTPKAPDRGGTTSQNLLVRVEPNQSSLQQWIHTSRPLYSGATIPKAFHGGGTTSENLLVVAEAI